MVCVKRTDSLANLSVQLDRRISAGSWPPILARGPGPLVNRGGTTGASGLSCGNVERIVRLWTRTLRDPWRTSRANHVLPLLAVPKTLRVKLRDNSWSERERILRRFRQG